MKRLIISMLLIGTCFLSACSNAQNSNTDNATASGKSKSEATTADEAGYDPYSVENKYDIPDSYFEKKSGVDYGTVLKDVTYYSTTAGDNKQCNILLPAGYDESQTYPVMYIFHGFSGSHNNQIDTDSYVTLLYGNMLHDNLTVPMILVNVDMYTDKQADKESKTEEELRYSYDKAVDDVAVDLMPFIEKNYPVKTGRENTAVADGFPQPTADTTPYYLYMTVGSEDPWNIQGTLHCRDVLNDMGVKNQTDYVDGYGHDADFWQQCFYNFLTKLFK